MKIAGLVATLLSPGSWRCRAGSDDLSRRDFDMTDAELQQAGADLDLELGTDTDNPMAGAFVRFTAVPS